MHNFFDQAGYRGVGQEGEGEREPVAAAPAAAPEAGLLANIWNGVKSLVSADTVKALAPAITAAIVKKVQDKTGAKVTAKAVATLPPGLVPAPKKGLPGWVVPVAIGVGALAIGGVILAKRKKG